MRLSRVGLSCLVTAAGGLLPLAAQISPTAPVTSETASDEIVQLEKFEVNEMKNFSDQAISGKTPVAFSELGKETITALLGSRDLPLVLNTTPSVYATADNGGAGESRVNVRGFSQRNISILINGVPTNDLENGWLYWSNWDGLGEVTSTIQVQRGLSNTALPTPSVGGTMNIVTDPAASRRGGLVKTEIGDDDFYKVSAVYNTGMLENKFAVTAGLTLKKGEGFADATWSKSAGYYLGATWKVNTMHRLELFAIGAIQQHGKRSFASNLAAYDVGFARELGYTDEQIYSTASGANAGALRQGAVAGGEDFNPNAAPVTVAYNGQQYYWGGTHSREKSGIINEVVNFSHKPQVNLNWYATISEGLKLTSVFYYSGVDAGSSGTLGSVQRYTSATPQLNGNVNWDATITQNRANIVGGAARSLGILRNSINNQEQFGAISKLTYEATPELTLSTGLDWRTAKIDHYREVRDLLGGDYYLASTSEDSDFWPDGTNTRLRLGDKVDYDNTNSVDWLGFFLQGQYEKGPLTAFGVYGYSMIEYSYLDHFKRAAPNSNSKLAIDSGTLDGQQVKGGVTYALNNQLSVFTNAGWVSKTPIFDGVINDVVGIPVPNVQNEKFNSYEAGVRWETDDRKFNVSASVYHTLWRNRTITVSSETANTLTYLRGVDSNYSGLEVEAAYQPIRKLRFDVAASYGDWTYQKDTLGEVFNITTGARTASSYYIRDLKVGDAPQTQVAYAATVYPVSGLSVKIQGRWYDRYWADFSPESRTVVGDYAQPWRVPSYTVYDLHVNYNLPLRTRRYEVGVFLHVFNLLNEQYISDATDESQFEAVGLNLAARHTVQRAEVFLGQRITFNSGIKVSF
jgi:iron complex outermembrane recepter protein